jgi:hypothetical protein
VAACRAFSADNRIFQPEERQMSKARKLLLTGLLGAATILATTSASAFWGGWGGGPWNWGGWNNGWGNGWGNNWGGPWGYGGYPGYGWGGGYPGYGGWGGGYPYYGGYGAAPYYGGYNSGYAPSYGYPAPESGDAAAAQPAEGQ